MPALDELGDALRAAGLVPRALAAWAGTDRISALPERLPELAAREPVPAATALALFVAGRPLPVARAGALPVDASVEAGLVERRDDVLHARYAIVPHARGLLVCDRRDARDTRELVAWPDDSSYHLAHAIPSKRRARWIDLGCGSAFAQLARPELAGERIAIDLNPRAVECARLGAALSRVALAATVGSVEQPPPERAELVTCNAPMLVASGRAIWRAADPGFFEALWPAIRTCLAPDGLAVIHAMRAGIPVDLPGERIALVYAPDFAVLWWRPDGPQRAITAHRELTADRPHVDALDCERAVAT